MYATPTYDNLPPETQAKIAKAYDSGKHVYFIRAAKTRLVKIGMAREPADRLKALQTGSPVNLRLLFVIPHGGFMVEQQLHELFKHLRVRNEWFKYDREIIDYIKEVKLILREQKWTRKANQLLRG